VQCGHITVLAGALAVAGLFAQAPQTGGNEQAPAGSVPVIKAETRVVLVDAVVTGKDGAYVTDLTQKDFRVLEDNKEQAIKSFSLELEASTASSSKRYLILFFDNSTLAPDEQIRARAAVEKFIDANAGGNLAMAVASFGGMLQIAQNFTTDAEKLKRAVNGPKPSAGSPGNTVEVASLGMPSLPGAGDFVVRTSLLALRSLARSLAPVQGRKTLILLTSSSRTREEYMAEVTAAISECNKANVAVYPIDVHGLIGVGPQGAVFESPLDPRAVAIIPAGFIPRGVTVWPYVRMASLMGFAGSPSPAQKGGGGGGGRGGGGGGGGFSGGGGGGGMTSGTGVIYGTYNNNMNNLNAYGSVSQARSAIVPQLPATTASSQQVMYMLASGTGGFVIASTNDLLSGLERIIKEQNQYYLLSYMPAESQEGSCHSIRVKVERSGDIVRARSGYCNVPPKDKLAGDPIEKQMEAQAVAKASGSLTGFLSNPFFYTAANAARVNVVVDFPSSQINAEKEKGGRFHAEVNILGIAYKADGAAAAQFSDTLKRDFADKDELQRFQQKPMHYENQFDVAPGKYAVKVVFSSGGSFGTVEAPLTVDPWDGRHFAMSGLAFSKEYHKVSSSNTALDAQLLEGRTPLIAKGMEIVPTGTTEVTKGQTAILYVEVYEPLIVTSTHPPQVALHLKVEDRKTGAVATDMGMLGVDTSVEPGNPVVPVGLQVPIDKLAPGDYRVVVQAMDSAGRSSVVRSMDLDVRQ
jgi:VWFA-related protein